MSPFAYARRTISCEHAGVIGIGRADEPVGRDQQGVLGVLEQLDHLVDELARRPARAPAARCAMLTECSSVPVRKRVSSPSIRCQRAIASAADHLVQRVEAGPVVRVGDRGGQVVARARVGGHGSPIVRDGSGPAAASAAARRPRAASAAARIRAALLGRPRGCVAADSPGRHASEGAPRARPGRQPCRDLAPHGPRSAGSPGARSAARP